jgi:hypothetical protein
LRAGLPLILLLPLIFCCAPRASLPTLPPAAWGVFSSVGDGHVGPHAVSGCFPSYQAWTLSGDGAGANVGVRTQRWGVPPPGPQGGSLRRDGPGYMGDLHGSDRPGQAPLDLRLRYDALAGHWVGSLGGRPLRLAPLQLTPPSGPCGDPPP